MTMPLNQILVQRRSISDRCKRLWHELEIAQAELGQLDEELFSRFGTLLDAFNQVAGSIPSAAAEDFSVEVGPGGVSVNLTTEPVIVEVKTPTAAELWGAPVASTAWAAPVQPKKENPLTEAIISVLQDADRPMKPSEIYATLLQRGVAISGKSPRNNVSAYLNNGSSKYFQKNSEGLWILRAKETA
jgi:hypothetical protein